MAQDISGKWKVRRTIEKASWWSVKMSYEEAGGFNVTFVQREGKLEGEVSNDETRMVGSEIRGVSLNGSIAFPKVEFSKQYAREPLSSTVPPIKFEGTLSADGKQMSGDWVRNDDRGSYVNRGQWTAVRIEQ